MERGKGRSPDFCGVVVVVLSLGTGFCSVTHAGGG